MGNKSASQTGSGGAPGESASLNPFMLQADDNKDGYEFPDGTKSRFKYEEKPKLKNIEGETKVDNILRVTDLKADYLKHGFLRNSSKVLEEIMRIKKSQSVKQYELDLTLAFWFAIHLEDLETAKLLMQQEFLLKQLVACALLSKKGQNLGDDEDEEHDDSEEPLDEEDEEQPLGSQRSKWNKRESFKSENLSDIAPSKQQNKAKQQFEGGEPDEPPKKTLGQVLLELKKMKEEEEDRLRREEERIQSQQALDAIGITQKMIQSTYLENLPQLLLVKQAFRIKFQNLMTNVLKIALQKEEEKLACIIIAYYEVTIEQEMIIKALSMDNYLMLQYLWAFEKNYIGQRQKEDAMLISFEQLFHLIIKQHIESRFIAEKYIRAIIDWKIISTDNILIALLGHHLDEIAIQFMGFYSHFLDKDLFIYSMMHGNNVFLQNALLVAAFDKLIFRDESVIDQILNVLKEGYRTNFLLNILTLIDISVWKNKYMKDLIEIINDYVEENYDKNRLLLSPNPLMSISLAAELLNKVGENRRKFENECNRIQSRLLELGRRYSAKIEDEKYYETLIMDQDFQYRTVIKIITENSFEPLMDEEDPKAENLIVMIWHGKEATRCDGNIYGYSNMMHIITTRAKKMSGKATSFLQMVSNFFEPNFNVDYSFQYRYRSKAISFFFQKEFACAFAMLVIFQYINYKYLILFSDNYLDSVEDSKTLITAEDLESPDKTAQKLSKLVSSIREYVDWNFFALFFSGALMFQLILKVIYNMCAKKKIGFDKWTIMDSLSAILNIAAVQLISRLKPEQLLESDTKDFVDYFMIFVLCICWLRFFTYFLVIRDISKLLLILVAMIGDTMAFMFIVCCFILIMSSIFTTLYQDVNPDKFGGLAASARALFDAAIGSYSYDGMEERELSFSILQIVYVFFGNILLMNYLIAILSTTYENMKQTGIFKYKVNLYQYCERFMIAFDEKSYGEIVLHPPPLSYLSAMMIPFVFSSFLMQYITKGFSYTMHWMENLIFIIGFLIFEGILFPIAYMKVWLNIILNSLGALKTIGNCIVWGFFGFPMMLFLVIRDMCYLMKILCYHQGCRYGKVDELAVEELPIDEREPIYNATRSTVIALYKRLQRHINQEGGALEPNEEEDELLQDVDVFTIRDSLGDAGEEGGISLNDDFLYVVKKSLIVDEWRKRCFLQERRKRIDAKSIFKISNLKNRLEHAFKQKYDQFAKKDDALQVKKGHFNNGKRENPAKKQKDIQNQLKNVFFENVKKGANQVMHQQTNQKKKKSSDEVDMSDFRIPDIEVRLVDNFLTKFTIVSESSMNEHIDIMLMLKALPNRVTLNTIEQIEMFNFRIFQESLIAFQNVDLVNAFEYFDEKNRERIQNLKDKLSSQKNNLNDVKDILELVKVKIERNEEHFANNKK